MKGKLIVIEGLDGSGKATQAKLLARTLEKTQALQAIRKTGAGFTMTAAS